MSNFRSYTTLTITTSCDIQPFTSFSTEKTVVSNEKARRIHTKKKKKKAEIHITQKKKTIYKPLENWLNVSIHQCVLENKSWKAESHYSCCLVRSNVEPTPHTATKAVILLVLHSKAHLPLQLNFAREYQLMKVETKLYLQTEKLSTHTKSRGLCCFCLYN